MTRREYLDRRQFITEWPTIAGRITISTSDRTDGRRMIPVKNIARVQITTHDPHTGLPRLVTPDYLLVEEPLTPTAQET